MLTSTVEAPTRRTAAARLDWVDAAKGLSILLVVLHHTVWYLQRSGQAPAAVIAANEALASLRMPLFFLASGLFVAGPLAAPWRTMLHKRVAFFVWLYLLWTLIRFTFFATLVPLGVDPDDSANPLNVVLALLLPGPSMWFLYALALFSVIGKLLRRVPVAVQLAASGVLSALAGAGLLDFDSRWTYMSRFLFFFLLGWHGKQLIERLARASSLPKVVAAAVGCVAVAFGVLFAAWVSRYVIGRPLVALGRRTLPIYLTHMLWLAAIVTGIRFIEFPSVVAYALPVVITVALVGLSLMTHWLLMRAGGTWLFALPSRLAYRTPATQPAG